MPALMSCDRCTQPLVGLLLIHEKEYVEALELFKRLLNLDPSNEAVRQQVANLVKHVERNKSQTVS